MVQDSISKYDKNTDLSVKKCVIDGRYLKKMKTKKNLAYQSVGSMKFTRLLVAY